MSIHIDNFDRTGGNGSRTREEDWLDENTTASENQWSNAKTTFYYWEAPAHRQNMFENLYDRHHGRGDQDRSSQLAKMKMMADTDSFCSILELPDSVAERVRHIIEEIDTSANNSGGKSYEKIILAVCSLAYDEYLSSRPMSEVQYEQRLIFDDTFRDLMEANDIGSNELRGIREQVRSKTSFF